MKANTQYNDLIGTSAADVSDFIGRNYGDNIQSIGKHFKINEERFKVVGIKLYGTDNFSISFICVDNEKCTDEKEFIVSMNIELPRNENKTILSTLFKRLSIVMYDQYDSKYSRLPIDLECNYSDFH